MLPRFTTHRAAEPSLSAQPSLFLSRRHLLAVSTTTALGALLGCGTTQSYASPTRKGSFDADSGSVMPGKDAGGAYALDDGGPSPLRADARYWDARLEGDSRVGVGPTCRVTDENILGPFYKEGAPFRNDIRDGEPGNLLLVSGVVLGHDGCTPLPGALVDVWQANGAGAYDTAGFTLRGRIQADSAGRYNLTTIFPGRYLNGSTYRPAHVHYRVSHPNNVDLTTQLYFSGDPYNATDPYVVDTLVMPVDEASVDTGLVRRVRFDIVLA